MITSVSPESISEQQGTPNSLVDTRCTRTSSEIATTYEGKETHSHHSTSGSNASDLQIECESPRDCRRVVVGMNQTTEDFLDEFATGECCPPTIAPLHPSLAQLNLSSVESPTTDNLEEDLLPLALKELPTHRTRTREDLFENARNFSYCSNPQVIQETCLSLVPGWEILTPEDINVDQIMAGLSNQLFKVHIRENFPDRLRFCHHTVLFRVYGKDVAELYDPSIEIRVFKQLGRRNVAPKLIADFEGGRIEEWIEGSALLSTDMKKPGVLAGVAAILAGIHQIDLSKTVDPVSSIKTYLNRWRDNVMEIYSRISVDQDHPSYLAFQRLNLPLLYDESFLLDSLILPEGVAPTPITSLAFCHNDIQENNLMMTNTCMRLIDFEYSGYNYPAYDIASYFWETTCDYCIESYPFFHIDPTRYPLIGKRRLFMAMYLSKLLRSNTKTSDHDRIDPCLDAVERFQLACHMLWAFWSVIRAPQAATASEFDMLYYAQKRIDAYWSQKAKLMNLGIIPREKRSRPNNDDDQSSNVTSEYLSSVETSGMQSVKDAVYRSPNSV